MNLPFKTSLLGVALFLLAASPVVPEETIPLWGDKAFERPKHIRGIHLTSWYTGSKKGRAKFEPLFAETELNTAVIDMKEINGEVYAPGVKWPDDLFTRSTAPALYPFKSAISKLPDYLTYLKERGVYTIARITVFQDQILPKLKPEWAVRSSSPLPKAVEKGFEPDIWVDNQGLAWSDPTNPRVHDYNIRIAERAAQLGFQEIQFDYIRFPADGATRKCIYSKPHYSKDKPKYLATFLKKTRKRLEPYNVKISIDVFGLAGSYKDGLGIGQKLDELLEDIDAVSPMMYPSHYAKGEYGIKDPNDQPYETIYRGVSDTLKVIKGSSVTLRPFFQDFSLRSRNKKYTPDMVRAQMQAAEDLGVYEWLLWNARCRYTRDALKPSQP